MIITKKNHKYTYRSTECVRCEEPFINKLTMSVSQFDVCLNNKNNNNNIEIHGIIIYIFTDFRTPNHSQMTEKMNATQMQ